eukprot:3934167-Rhodomonas_salina.3
MSESKPVAEAGVGGDAKDEGVSAEAGSAPGAGGGEGATNGEAERERERERRRKNPFLWAENLQHAFLGTTSKKEEEERARNGGAGQEGAAGGGAKKHDWVDFPCAATHWGPISGADISFATARRRIWSMPSLFGYLVLFVRYAMSSADIGDAAARSVDSSADKDVNSDKVRSTPSIIQSCSHTMPAEASKAGTSAPPVPSVPLSRRPSASPSPPVPSSLPHISVFPFSIALLTKHPPILLPSFLSLTASLLSIILSSAVLRTCIAPPPQASRPPPQTSPSGPSLLLSFKEANCTSNTNIITNTNTHKPTLSYGLRHVWD